MRIPGPVIVILILIIAFLTSSTFYLFNKSRSNSRSTKVSGSTTFQADLPRLNNEINQKIDSMTKPAASRGRLSFPTNSYEIAPRESLVTVAAKFELAWQLLKSANSISNENLIQAGDILIIPKLHPETDNFRLYFSLDEVVASELNQLSKEGKTGDRLDPLTVAKAEALEYFDLTSQNLPSFLLKEKNANAGVALVEAKNSQDEIILIGLIQPKIKGENGIWALYYIELLCCQS